MEKIKRGRFTISANIFITATMITRVFAFAFIMMSVYIRSGDDLLDDDVVRVADVYDFYGLQYGSALRSLIFSLAGVFGLELLTGIIGLYGVLRRKKVLLVVTIMLSFLLLAVYIIYITLFAVLYGMRYKLKAIMIHYTRRYWEASGGTVYLSHLYQYGIFRDFMTDLECEDSVYNYNTCWNVYSEQLSSYIKTYFGTIATCILCQVVSIVAIEYTYRKFEIKEKGQRISNKKYRLLLTFQHGIVSSCLRCTCVRTYWKKSKWIVLSVAVKICSLITGCGLVVLGLVIVSNEMIRNDLLEYILYTLQFYDYYLYDIIVGLAAASTVIGVSTIFVAILNLIGSWRKSKRLVFMSMFFSFLLNIPRLACFIIWIVFIEKINSEICHQLWIQQEGYFDYTYAHHHTTAWNTMMQKLDCCGVYSSSEMDSRQHFCLENAKEISVSPSEYYTTYTTLDYSYYGRGSKKTTTCSERILWRLRVAIGLFCGTALLQIFLETVGYFFVKKEFAMTTSKGVKYYLTRMFNSSRMNVLLMGSTAAFTLFNFGLLVLAIQLKYDKIFGNRYIRDHIFADISISSHSIRKILDNFHIVVTTFSLASIDVAIYTFIIKYLKMDKRLWNLLLVCVMVSLLFVASLVQIGIIGKVTNDIIHGISNGLQNDIIWYYRYSDSSAKYDHWKSVAWNTLFVKGHCCGASSVFDFLSTPWYKSHSVGDNRVIPEYCCESEPVFYPYTDTDKFSCTNFRFDYHTDTCGEALIGRFKTFVIPYFVISTLVVVSEVFCIICTIVTMCCREKENSGQTELEEEESVHSCDKQKDTDAEQEDVGSVHSSQKENDTDAGLVKNEGQNGSKNKNNETYDTESYTATAAIMVNDESTDDEEFIIRSESNVGHEVESNDISQANSSFDS